MAELLSYLSSLVNNLLQLDVDFKRGIVIKKNVFTETCCQPQQSGIVQDMLSSGVTSDLCDVHPVRYILTLTRSQDVTSQTVKFEFVSSAGCTFSNFLVKKKDATYLW